MKKRLIIAVDIDDVLIATSSYVVEFYNNTYGTHIGLEEMYSENLKRWGVSDRATSIARVEQYLGTEEFQCLPPLKSTLASVGRLSQKHRLHIVTGRSTIIETATRDTINKHFPDIFQSVVFTNLYNQKVRNKAEVCQEICADLLIEDHLGHALPVAGAGITVLLFGNYPWNQTDKLPANVHRVKNWHEAEEFINAKS